MKNLLTKLHLLLFAIFSVVFSYGQIDPLINVSYQELTTKIISQTSDEDGNVYYAGIFKGALVVEGDTLAYGLGGEDLFLLKRDVQGQLIWSKAFGSEANEVANFRITWISGRLYYFLEVFSPITIDTEVITPQYNQESTYCLIQLDEMGEIQWKLFTNQFVNQLQPTNGASILLLCANTFNSDNVKFNDVNVFLINKQRTALFIKLGTDGTFKDCKEFKYLFNQTSSLSIVARNAFENNRFYFLVGLNRIGSISGSNSLFVNGSIIDIPEVTGIHLLIKTDTLFNVISHRIINPTGTPFYAGAAVDEFRFQFNRDSSNLHLFINSGAIALDGVNEVLTAGRVGMVTLDTNLVAIRFQRLFQSSSGYGFSFFQETKDGVFLMGTLPGSRTTSAPVNPIQNNVPVLFGNDGVVQFDRNGIHKTFIVKLDHNFNFSGLSWIGDHSILEVSSLNLTQIHMSGRRIRFLLSHDNLFNPWEYSTELQNIRGSSIPLADQVDYVERVEYFENKTRFLLGLTHGLNAFDSVNAGINKSFGRQDVFLALLDSSNSLVKYVRSGGSFNRTLLRKVLTYQNKVYSLVSFLNPKNPVGFNYLNFGSDTIHISTPSFSLLMQVDSSGTLSYQRVDNLPIGSIIDFDFFENGDYALMTNTSNNALTLNGLQFPSGSGFYLARMTSDLQILQVMKMMSTHLSGISPRNISVMKETGDIQYLLSATVPSTSQGQLVWISARGNNNNGLQFLQDYIANASRDRVYHLAGRSNFNQDFYLTPIGPSSMNIFLSFATIGLDTYVVLNSNLNDSTEVFVKDQSLIPLGNPFSNILFRLDSIGNLGKYYRSNPDPGANRHDLRFMGIKAIGGNLYLSGVLNKDLSLGALKIPHFGSGDGITMKFDTAMNLLQYYSVSTIYQDINTDVALAFDSSMLFAFRSQGNPTPRIGLLQIEPTSLRFSDLDESGWIGSIDKSAIPNDFIFTVRNGSWHDSATWSTGSVPLSTDRVFIRHKVQLLQNAECFQLLVDPGADVQVMGSVDLRVRGSSL